MCYRVSSARCDRCRRPSPGRRTPRPATSTISASRASRAPKRSSGCASPESSPPKSSASPARGAPGVTTEEIDAYVHQLYIERDSYPSPLNYNGYPKSVCTSVNEVICHGIPDSRPLVDGDIVNLDVTAYHGGVHGDTNATFFVGDVDPQSHQLVRVTEEAMWLGIEAVKPGRPLSDIGKAIETHAKKYRYGVIRAFVGHGIGEEFHGDIQVLHYYDTRNSLTMRPGMTFTIEPMISLGSWQFRMWDDDWTAVTADGNRTAQFEHTILVTDDGFDVFTGGDGAVSPTAPWNR